jgi:hypothetical protein
MPLALWLLLGGVAAYLVFKSGQTAAATASAASSNVLGPVTPTGTVNLSVSGPKGVGPFSVPVESTLPVSLQNQFASLFVNADQPSFSTQTVADFSNQLAGLGFSIAAGSVQSVWQMVIAGLNAQQGAAVASSSTCPPGTHPPTPMEKMIGVQGTVGDCVPDKPSSSATTVPRYALAPEQLLISKIQVPSVQK